MKAWEDEVEEICLHLTPPLLLSSYDSWYYPKGDTEEDRKEATNKITAVRRWVDETVLDLLRRLLELVLQRGQENTAVIDQTLKAKIVIATSVYISPRRESLACQGERYNLTASREPWITAANTKLAKSILSQSLLGSLPVQDSEGLCLDITLVSHLLEAYIKPLFRETPSRKIDSSTGRATRAIPNLANDTVMASSGALMEDEIIWKGGDIDHAVEVMLLGCNVVFEVRNDFIPLQARHRGLGSYGVLYICCCSIAIFQRNGSSSWESFWPLILPPLMTLLEDSSPIYRLLGTRILSTTLLKDSGKGMQVGTLLLRTGVATLLRQILESSLTFISTKLSAPLLQSSAESLILLNQLTTADIRSSHFRSTHIIQDGGRERFEQLSRLVDDGVLRIWAYAPASVSALVSEGEAMQADIYLKGENEAEEREATDVVNASIDVLTRLTQGDALGVGIARYLDVVLEFLIAQLMGLETKIDRRKASQERTLSLERETCSARAIEALLIVCRKAPGIRTWSARCLDGVARCWTLLQDRQNTYQIQQLHNHLNGIVDALLVAQPAILQAQLQMLLDLDGATFTLFVGDKIAAKK